MIKGLLLKEIYNMKAQLKIWIALYVFYVILGIFSKKVDLLFLIVPMLAIIMCINMMAADVQNKWDEFVLCTPVKRSTVVIAQYLFILLVDLVTVIVAVTAGLCMRPIIEVPVQELLAEGFGVFAAGLVLVDISFPLQYKFGIEKARYLLMAAALLPTALILLANKLGVQLPAGISLKGLLYLLPVLLVALTAFSALSCIRIYQKKEY